MIQKMLNVSNKHISKETADWLNEQGLINATSHETRVTSRCHIASHGFGWIIYYSNQEPHADSDYPEQLLKLFKWAKENFNCDYLNLDADGDEHNGLETFEW